MTPPKKNDWLSPPNLLAVLGMVGMTYASYLNFQRDTTSQVQQLTFQVAALQKQNDIFLALKDVRDKQIEEIYIRLDRLDHGSKP